MPYALARACSWYDCADAQISTQSAGINREQEHGEDDMPTPTHTYTTIHSFTLPVGFSHILIHAISRSLHHLYGSDDYWNIGSAVSVGS
jgi:hypothetical protein